MTNNKNIEVIVSKMLNTLHSSTDSYFRNTLVLKITALAERYAPSHEWYIDTMCLLFELGSEYLNEQILNNFLKLVVENCEEDEAFSQEIIGKMLQLMNKVVPTDFIIKAVSWILGEIGSSQEPQKIEELCLSLIKCLEYDYEAESNKVWVIDAIIKLSSTKEFQLHEKVKAILNAYSGNNEIELYQRSLESKKLAKYNAALRFHNKISFDEDLSFLEGFVSNARRNGAK